jgi:hypothetical protein
MPVVSSNAIGGILLSSADNAELPRAVHDPRQAAHEPNTDQMAGAGGLMFGERVLGSEL